MYMNAITVNYAEVGDDHLPKSFGLVRNIDLDNQTVYNSNIIKITGTNYSILQGRDIGTKDIIVSSNTKSDRPLSNFTSGSTSWINHRIPDSDSTAYIFYKDDGYYYKMVEDEAIKNNIQIAYIHAGMEFNCGNVRLKCLHPSSGYQYSSENEYSVVLKASYGEFDMLFTGDLDDVAEQNLLERSAFDDIELLKVAHHGSKYSTSNEFLMCVKPENALISCGRNNSYGHPHEETIERLEAAGSRILRTDEHGAIMLSISPSGKLEGKWYR